MKKVQETDNTLQQWLVRRHGKVKAGRSSRKDKNTCNNTQVTNKHFDQRIKLCRQLKRKQQLRLRGNKALSTDLKEYGHQYDQEMDTLDTHKVRIHSHNINTMPQYTTHIKNRSIINELKRKTADIHLWQETGICWPKVETRDNWRSRTKGLIFHVRD